MVRNFSREIEGLIIQTVYYIYIDQEKKLKKIIEESALACEYEPLELIDRSNELIKEFKDKEIFSIAVMERIERLFADARSYDVYIDKRNKMSIMAESKALISILENMLGMISKVISADTNAFRSEINTIDDGLYKKLFDSINPVTVEGQENLYRFLLKNPKMLTELEKAAIIAVIDSCIIPETDERISGVCIDYEKLSMILTGFYYRSQSSSNGYNTYVAVDMLPYIAKLYDEHYREISKEIHYMKNPLTKYADVNAVLTGLSLYYGTVRTVNSIDSNDPYDEYGNYRMIPFGIRVSEETLNDNFEYIVISTVEDDYDEIDSNLLQLESFEAGRNDIVITRANDINLPVDEVLRNNNYNALLRLSDTLWTKITGTAETKLDSKIRKLFPEEVMPVYGRIEAFAELIESTEKHNEEIYKLIDLETYSIYSNSLHIGGNVIMHKSDVIITNDKINENLLRVDLAYVNQKTGSSITVDDVLEELLDNTNRNSSIRNTNVIEKINTALKDGNASLQGNINTFRDRVNMILPNGINGSTAYEIENAINTIINSPETGVLN